MKTNNLSKVITQVKSLNQSGKSHEKRLDRLEKVLGQTIVLMHEGFSISLPGNKSYTKKDPTKSSVGPSENRPLKVGDSSADILAKMFNFSVKVQHQDKKQKQLENKLDMEQLEEDERRHKGLLKSISKIATAKRIPKKKRYDEEDKSFSFIDLITGGIKGFIGVLSSGLDFIISHLGIIAAIAGVAEFIMDNKDAIMKVISPVKDAMGKVTDAVGDFFNGKNGKLQELLMTIYSTVTEMIGKSFGGFVSELADAATESWDGLISSLNSFRSDPIGKVKRFIALGGHPAAPIQLEMKKTTYGEDYIGKVRKIIEETPDTVKERVFGWRQTVLGNASIEAQILKVLENPQYLGELQQRYLSDAEDVGTRGMEKMGGAWGAEPDFQKRSLRQHNLERKLPEDLIKRFKDSNFELINPNSLHPRVRDKTDNKEYDLEKDSNTLYFLMQTKEGLEKLKKLHDKLKKEGNKLVDAYEEGKANPPAAGPGQPTMEQTVSRTGGKITSFMDNAVDSLKSIPILQEFEEGYQQGVNLIKLPGQAVSAPSKQKNDAPSGTILCRNPNETYFGITLDNTCPF